MEKELITTSEYLLYIDKKAEIKKGDYLLEKESIINVFPDYLTDLDECDKIIAYRKLNENAKELDLPLLPPFEDNFNDLEWNDIADEDWKSRGGEGNRSHFMYRQGYIHGAYKALQTQSKQFSLEDIKKAINFDKYHYEYGNITASKNDEEIEKFIQSLSTQQLPNEFIPETEVDPTNPKNWYEDSPSGKYWEDEPVPPSPNNLYTNGTRRLKTITNSEGKKILVGTWKY